MGANLRVCFIGNSKPYQILKMVDFAEMETQFPIKHKILENSRLQIYPGEDEVPVEKYKDESGV